MQTPKQVLEKANQTITARQRTAFLSAFIIGMLIHMPIMLSDIPNHDGLASMYFDQNMITSGRWLLGVACGFSSYFTIPWIIGILGMLYLSLTAVVLSELFDLKSTTTVILMSGLLVSFPALTSTFAYVFTMDGYMLALLFAVSSVYFTKKSQFGFLKGAVLLGCSLGIYQAYLPVAVLLCIGLSVPTLIGPGKPIEKIKGILRYLYMGVLGCMFYYACLRILLLLQGEKLANYQGINGEGMATLSPVALLVKMYRDFIAFTLKGNVLFNSGFSAGAVLILAMVLLFSVLWLKKPSLLVIMGMVIAIVPLATNIILVITPNVTYHLLMRYQWVLFLILALAMADRWLDKAENNEAIFMQWAASIAALVLIFNYAVTDNIAYSNLEKRYEKTYAYCVRLLDRIEQTEGYYQGIPIAMIGVVGDEQFPSTDLTEHVTSGMIGMNGDILLYTGANYQAFIKYYLGASLNILEPDVMSTIYYSPEYVEMDSFPGPNSVKVVDGILYVKTENVTRD